jgi:IS4 transposase
LKVNFNDWETRTRLKTTFRLIKARVKSTGEMMHFVSNNFELTALEITEIYRKRWEIESFFRFIKQELNFSQLINRNLNGVKVMIYMTLILASLIIVYKKKNQLKGYKIVKQKITNEIQQELIREIVILSGGNPDNISYIFDD